MTQYRLTVQELEKMSSDASSRISAQNTPDSTNNDPILLVTVVTGSSEWTAADFASGDVLTALSGTAGEQIRCRYRFAAGVDGTTFSAHNLRWDRPEGDVLYANVISRNRSAVVTNATSDVVAAVESMIA